MPKSTITSMIVISIAFLVTACARGVEPGAYEAIADERTMETFQLKSEVFGNTRNIRVYLPRDYFDLRSVNKAYPVFYVTDGAAAFDGRGWNFTGVIDDLDARDGFREFIFIAIDNGGGALESTMPQVDRASEYLPYPDQSWTQEPIPQARGGDFPAFLFDEVAPEIERRYRIMYGANNTGLAGSSYGGLITLYTLMNHPEKIGLALVESPSLHVGKGVMIEKTSMLSEWCGKIHIGVGGKEGDEEAHQTEMKTNAFALANAIKEDAPGAELHFEFVEDGVHWYDAWKARLPDALSFLLLDTEAANNDRCSTSK